MRPSVLHLATPLLLLFSLSPIVAPAVGSPPETGLCAECREFNELNSRIRDRTIGRADAKARVADLLPGIRRYYYERGGKDYPAASWVFPVEGYTARAVAARGKGYIAKGYCYFDGNIHKAHPSFDIFIHDRNRDDLDDGTGKPVSVLSMTGGIVVALEPEWDKGSELRGGKYIWIYSPADEALVYYAHNRDLRVSLGDVVRPGDPIATVGRTGLNAYKKRSPTHLHLTYLKIRDGYPAPHNIYDSLLRCRRGAKGDRD